MRKGFGAKRNTTAIQRGAPIAPLLDPEYPGLQRWHSDILEIYTIKDLLSAEECDQLQGFVEKHLRPSQVVGELEAEQFRTSQTCFLSMIAEASALQQSIQSRICGLLGVPLEAAEPLQAQFYQQHQQYTPHFDYFTDVVDDSACPAYYAVVDNQPRTGQRSWSCVAYLSEGEAGSGTYFPEIQQEFAPARGSAVLWRNLYPDNTPNPHSLHQGLPVQSEHKKMILTQWVRVLSDDEASV